MKTLLSFVTAICLALPGVSQVSLPHPAPIPDFGFTNLCLGDSTYFINKTQMSDTYQWQIFVPDSENGDSMIYENFYDKDIVFLFPDTGTYKVILWADNGHRVEKTRMLSIGSQTKAGFDFVPCLNYFLNLSSCSDSSLWDFGDGDTSTEAMPTHKYLKKGVYNVTLIAKRSGIWDTLVKVVNVKSTDYPVAGFTYAAGQDSVYFFANDSTAKEYHWSFGDNTYADILDSSGHRIAHHYVMQDSTYEVSLLTGNYCGFVSYWTSVDASAAAVQERGNARTIDVRPNPAKDFLNFSIHLTTPADIQISLFDLSGKLMAGQVMNYSSGGMHTPLAVGQLAVGLYYLQIKAGEQVYHQKVCISGRE